MKKLIAVILILALAAPVLSLAEIPDVSDLSNEELTELNHRIQELIFSRQLVDGITVNPGTYVVGVDIPAGIYRIEITGTGGFYDLYESEGGRKLETGLTGRTYDVYNIGKMTLADGNVLVFRNSTFIFFPYTGVFY